MLEKTSDGGVPWAGNRAFRVISQPGLESRQGPLTVSALMHFAKSENPPGTAEIEPNQQISRSAARKLVLLLGILAALGPVAIDTYLPALPAVAKDLHEKMGLVELSVPMFLIGMAVGQIFYGPISDRFGRKMPLFWGTVLYTIGAAICAFAPNIWTLLAGRAITAIGGAAGVVITRAIVRDRFDAKDSAKFYGTLMLVMGAAPILAPQIGSQLLLFTSWRGIFVVMAVAGLICVAMLWFGLKETHAPDRTVDENLGEVLRTYGRLLATQPFIGYVLSLGFMSSVLFAYITGISSTLIGVYHLDPQHFALLFSLIAAGLIGSSQANQLLLKRWTSRQILMAAFFVMASASIGAVICSTTHFGGLTLLIALLFLVIGSMGLSFPNITAAAMEPFDKDAGSASSVLGTAQYAIGSVGGILTGAFHDGTALPMMSIIAISGILGWASLRFLTRVKPGTVIPRVELA